MPYFVLPSEASLDSEGYIAGEHHSACQDPEGISSRIGAFLASTAQDAHERKPQGFRVIFWQSQTEYYAWADREQARLSEGEYITPPWENQGYTPRDGDMTLRHYAHLSLTKPGMVAFTKSAEHGLQDRQTVLTAGRYLQRYLSRWEGYHQKWIGECQADQQSLHFARTADEIEEVYNNRGPGSCMTSGHDFDSEVHPCRVYGDSDLSIAYTGPIDAPTARCIVWESKHFYGRAYGHTNLIQALLRQSGFEHTNHMTGARVQAIKHSSDVYVMPYIDGIDTVGLERGADGKRYMVLGGDGYCAQNTNGLTSVPDTNECNHCGNSCGADEAYCDECDQNRNHCDRCEQDHWDGGEYCDSCRQNMTQCDQCNEWADDDDTWSIDSPSVVLCNGCYESYGSRCAVCECYCCESQRPYAVRTRREADGTQDVCTDCEVTHQFCEQCDEWIEKTEPCSCAVDHEAELTEESAMIAEGCPNGL